MRLRSPSNRLPVPAEPAYAIVLVMAFTAISRMLVGSVLTWSDNNAAMTARSTQYFRSVAAAEAATELVLSEMAADYKNQGETYVYNSLSNYRNRVPKLSDNAWWKRYTFSDAQGSN